MPKQWFNSVKAWATHKGLKAWKFELQNCKRRRVWAQEENRVSQATRETRENRALQALKAQRVPQALWVIGALQAILGLLDHLDQLVWLGTRDLQGPWAREVPRAPSDRKATKGLAD